MKKLYFIILFHLLTISIYGQQNPHGNAFDINCTTCHTSDNWIDLSRNTFDHDQTRFILRGAHKNVDCVSCHIDLKFIQTANNCFECHTDIHKNELGNGCNDCHTENGWDDRLAFIQFHNQTDFPLTGVHAMIDCESCHFKEQQRQFANTPVECANCHLNVFMTTLNPNHQKAGFDSDCQNCHLTNSRGWKRSIFEHSKNFPLSGGHDGIDCEDCHGVEYNIQNVVCVDCHSSEFDATVNPNHMAFSFSQDCEECHTGISWQRTIFNHLAVSGFALEGRHNDILCADCHQNNQLSGLPLECIGCHQQEYNSSNDPNHLAALFPVTCENCHSVKGWQPATWDHDGDYFPIYSGKHREEWDDCSDCHINPANYVQFECIFCHEHRQSEMDDKHRGRSNYVYQSQACYECHPRGRE